ncbi:MAG TPA: DUF4124 domain-containing protein [Burkholderiales bacterium]|nr:DUF4124 domain-containing protein [Burkholderiales bacterium]
MRFRGIALFLALVALQSAALAETCKYVDGDGRVIYSNTPSSPPKGATKIKCFADPAPAPPAAAKEQKPNGTSDARPRPSASDSAQKTRDDDRRRILEQELADETNQLAQAKQQLAEQEAVRNGNERNYQRYLDRVQPYRDAVATHERNIDALKRELANLK